MENILAYIFNLLDYIEEINETVNAIVWGPPFMVLLIGTGLYLSIRLEFFQFTHLGHAWRKSFGTIFTRDKSKEKGEITSFQAVSSAMAATIGVGNIAGVSTALASGGPGAIFWMWISALVGMATKFGEAALGVKFRNKNIDGSYSGGVMQYIENGLGSPWKFLAVIYALLAGLAAFGIGNMVQANTMAGALSDFGIPSHVTGILAIILVGLVTLGGVKRIASIAAKIVPIMTLLYIAGSLLIIILNFQAMPATFARIFTDAFTGSAAAGGFAGATVSTAIRYGFARGIFSNEAGLGAASIVHAQAKNSPTNQGMWGIWEVFIDTIVVATMTSLVILSTGALEKGESEAALAATGFELGLPGPGNVIVLASLVLFSYTTMLTWNFYGEKSWEYILGRKIVVPYRLIFLVFLFVGSIGGLELVWGIADTLNGLMAAPNLLALFILGGVLVKEKSDYLKKL
ncbi:alanine/glycine:cation symporter family protein [Natranaerofaba carboxydovora]|uniref:alanine/glycine:cation symporter family protein n=1 Tax=Natranaerofaba carboxydovora TaxID=2742683 RepID=UPI001F14572F|nr:sodium:alanine symporter family protein [Natranaerofaba carboxydovora]UMZ73179.1 Amino-acid carrier protein AlsT [Natranaerofaba carboxydovora]